MLNVDPIASGIFLWREPSVRAVLAQNANNFQLPVQTLVANPEEAMQAFRNQFVGLNSPIGWVTNSTKHSDLKAPYDSKCQLFPEVDQAIGLPVLAGNR